MRSTPGVMRLSRPRARAVPLALPNGGGRSSERPVRSLVRCSLIGAPLPALGMSTMAVQAESPRIPGEERRVAGRPRLQKACILEIDRQQTARQTTADRQTRRVGCVARGPDDGMNRFAEPGRGNAVGCDLRALKRDLAAHRRQPPPEPGGVDPIVMKRNAACHRDRPIASSQGNPELEVDGAVPLYRQGVDHRAESCSQRTLGEKAHGVGAGALDTSFDPYHRHFRGDVLNRHRGFPDGGIHDASRTQAHVESSAGRIEPRPRDR